ncbi:MAG: hypothetical protein UDG86_00545 [Lachnospiraceae bacterium]|nr:hypothetical protein [Lachnospiraceae bacterium]
MKDEKRIHELLKHALSEKWEPTEELNKRILKQIEEGQNMQKKNGCRKRKVVPGLALAAVLILLMGVTCFAAVKLLSLKQVVEKMENPEIEKAFESKDAVKIDQTVIKNGYEITLMGIARGEQIQNFDRENPEIQSKSTYAVVAIAKEDGTPMDMEGENAYDELFFISPLVKGLEPWQYNIGTMNGSYCEDIVDGIRYRIIQCDDIEIFADRGVYLSVLGGGFYNSDAYHFDEKSGEITANKEYNGINLLFDLPLDAGKANPEEATRYLNELEEQWKSDTERNRAENSEDAQTLDTDGIAADMSAEEAANTINGWKEEIDSQIEQDSISGFLKGKELLEESRQDVTVENGFYSYQFQLASGMGGTYQFAEKDFVNGIAFTIQSEKDGEGEESVYLILVQKKQEGAEGMVYQLQ